MAVESKKDTKNPTYSTIVFYYMNINGDRYPVQTTISSEDKDAYVQAMETFLADFLDQKEDEPLKYEPRDVSAGYNKTSNKPALAKNPDNNNSGIETPNCPIHGEPISIKNGRNGPFASCSKKNQDGSYCNWQPPRK